jgi:carboxymethylenebutenolidase
MRDYLATEVALDHAEGHLTRREALQRLGLLGLSAVAATGLLAACGSEAAPPPPAPAAPPPATPDYDVAAALARTSTITFAGGTGELSGAFAVAEGTPRGAVVVIHENRGLTDHIRAVAGRLAGDGYTALAPDLLSRVGGTSGVPDATAALGTIPEADLVADVRSSLAELGRRAPGTALAAVGFCFGGGMVWRLLNSGPSELAAAVPFYGPAPENPSFTGVDAAVLGVFAENDARVNAGLETLDSALSTAGVRYEIVVVPGVGHAFFNDTGPRYDARAASEIYQRMLAWFGANLA